MVICLERGADLHMAQLMPLPLTVSCFSKIQIGFTFLLPAHLDSPGKRAVKRVCVCVCCICLMYDTNDMDIIRGLGGVIRVGWHWQHRSDVWISEWDVESGQFISQWPLGKRHSWQRGRVICRTRHSACMWRWMERSHSNLWSQYDHCVAGKLGLMCEVQLQWFITLLKLSHFRWFRKVPVWQTKQCFNNKHFPLQHGRKTGWHQYWMKLCHCV